MEWVAYKQPTFITHSSEGWEIQDDTTNRFMSGEDPLPWLSSPCNLTCRRGKCAFKYLFDKGTNLIHHLPKALPPSITTSGLGSKHMNFRGTQTLVHSGILLHYNLIMQSRWNNVEQGRCKRFVDIALRRTLLVADRIDFEDVY